MDRGQSGHIFFRDEVSPNLKPGRFYGHIVRQCNVSGFNLSESRYAPGTKLSPHSHSRAYLSILLNGGYREVFDRIERVCSPSTLIFHPAGEVHSEHFLGAGGTIFRFEFGREWLDSASEEKVPWDEPWELTGGHVGWLTTCLYAEFTRMDAFSSVVIHGMILEILGQTARESERTKNKQPVWLKRVTEFMREAPPEELAIHRVAELAGVHVGHLARVFRQFCGCSVGEYIRRLRIEYAARELRSSERALADIATAAGFSDQSHFCRSFKLATGATPAQYRGFFEPR